MQPENVQNSTVIRLLTAIIYTGTKIVFSQGSALNPAGGAHNVITRTLIGLGGASIYPACRRLRQFILITFDVSPRRVTLPLLLAYACTSDFLDKNLDDAVNGDVTL